MGRPALPNTGGRSTTAEDDDSDDSEDDDEVARLWLGLGLGLEDVMTLQRSVYKEGAAAC